MSNYKFRLKRLKMREVFVILCGLEILCSVPQVWTARCSSGDDMGTYNPSSYYTNNLGSQAGRQVVAKDYTSNCCGVVTAWQFYVGRTGTIYLQIWRDAGGNTYSLVGQNTITLSTDSYEETTTLSAAEQIAIVSGDMIGWYSDNQDIITYQYPGPYDGYHQTTNTVPTVGGVISQPSSQFYNRKYDVTAQLSPGNSPSFTNLDASVTVSCQTANLGDVVYTVTATDADVSDVLTVTMDSVTPSSHFAFDDVTGEVSVSTSAITITTYTLTFSVSDGCSTTTNTLTVIISNSVPYFSNLGGSVSLGCYNAVGTPVFTVTVVDDDRAFGDIVTVTLNSITPSTHVNFNATSGVVSVSSSSLAIGVYILSFTATDSCGQTDTNTLTITVTDTVPYFSNLGGSVSLGCYNAVGTPVFTVTVVNDDRAFGDIVTVTLNSITPSTHVNFNATSGVVSVSSSSLAIGVYILSFTATDSCGQTDTNTLTITVTDTVPYFSNLGGSVSLGCYNAVGTPVFTVTVVNDDRAFGDIVTVTLNSITPSTHVNFNATSGVVSVSSSSLAIGVYILSFTATDSCGQTDTNTLTITVTDTVPYFSNLDGSVSLGCYNAVGIPVFTVTVVDDDSAFGDIVTVTLNSITPSTHFNFNATSGVVSVSSSSLAIGVYILSFTATDSCGQTDTNTLTITVTDTSPYFSNLNAVTTSLSNLAVGTVMYTVTSVDDDISDGDAITATLDSTSPANDFTFNVTSGEISTVTSPLTTGDYTLTFTVSDSCGQSATNTLTITVYNQVPVITSLPATIDVREDVTSATLLHTVMVTDADGHSITCVISNTSPASAPFSMKLISNGTQLENGVYLNANAGLDYSSVDTYTLDIQCSDGYDSDTRKFYVYIVQNGMPLISNLQNSTTVSTTTNIGSEVFAVLAEDTEGDALSFALICTTAVPCPFTIYSTGSMLLSTTLLGSTTLAYELDITASDSYSTTAAHRLTVFVSDLNTAPVLSNLPRTIQVSEDSTLGSSIFLLSVYDGDGDTTFTIDVVYTPTTGVNRFVIDDAALTISLATSQSLDYESQSEYTLNLTASDGTETSSWRLLTVQVADVNESPKLTKTHYYVSQNEGSAGTAFTAPVMQVSDPDLGDTLTFSVENGSNASCGLLSINMTTGIMGYETDFDVDDTSLASYFTCLIKVEDTGGLAVTATVTVSIQDINDNQPQFATHSYVTSLSQSALVGTSLYTLSVLDNDVTTANQMVSYSMSQSATYFALSSSGVVMLASDVSGVADGTTLTATISVNNVGYSVSDTLTIYLTIIDDGDDDFWDSGANIAWVTLTCVLVVLLAALTAFLVYKCKSRGCCKGSSRRFFKVQPREPQTKVAPRPREDYMRHPLSPYLDNTRSLTPTDVHLARRWDAWSAKGGTGWSP